VDHRAHREPAGRLPPPAPALWAPVRAL